MTLNTPVVFLIYRRPDTTTRVFAEIARARPAKLLVVADGPRPNVPGEAKRCAQTRAIIENIDWDCEVLTNYVDVNMGLKNRISSGLKWVFEQVEEAIILEDDCLPHPTFFRFCEELLEKYKYDTRIGTISGDNFQCGKKRTEYSYYFSRYFHCWGWASWRRSMALFDPNISLWPEVRDKKLLQNLFEKPEEGEYWCGIFESIYRGEIDTWAYGWIFMSLLNRSVSQSL